MTRTALALILTLGLLGGCGDDSGATVIDGRSNVDGTGGGGDGGGGTPDAAPITCDPVTGVVNLALEEVQRNFDRPVFVTSPPGDPRLFVVEEAGHIQIVGAGEFLNIEGDVECCGEEGLLGLAFHPQYASNRRFFIYYIDNGSDIQITEFHAMESDPNQADVSTRRPLLHIDHTLVSLGNRSNHNGGMIAFGQDGNLYISTGDGGYMDDPDENGQNTNVLLGKILRIDVDTGDPYGIPSGNPFGDEIWAYGLRNPWRFSFDRMSGDLYIGDVGQGTWEEVDFALNGDAGLNFGWDILEGEDCHEQTAGSCSSALANSEHPITTISTGSSRAVIGGYVYRGCKMPDLNGTYFYGTLNGAVQSLRYASGSITNEQTHDALTITAGSDRLSAFGEDYAGELYLCALDEGVVYKIVPAP